MQNEWSLPLRAVPSKAKKDQTIVWNKVHLCYEQKLFGQVTSLRYNTAGTMLGATSTNQFVLLRVPHSDGVVVNEQTQRKNFSVSFRDDDKLFVHAVDQRVIVKAPETAFARSFYGHTREVRRSIFLGRHNFVSASDDTTVKLWDLLSETELDTARVHIDYVRSLESYTGGCFFSGSYDHTVCLWDPRATFAAPLQSTGCLLTDAVEALCFIEGSNTLAVGSGDQVTLFDVRKGMQTALFQGSFHTKSITSIAYSAEHKSLLTASLDCRLKIYTFEGDELRCLATKKFDNPLAAVAVHPASTEYAVGTGSGEVKIFKLKEVAAEQEDDGVDESLFGGEKKKKSTEDALAEKMHDVQHQLSKFQYGKALKTALYSRFPEVVVSALEELIRRGALHVAMNNQNDRTVVWILRFATDYLDKPQFTDAMLEVFEVIFEIYSTCVGQSAFLHREMLIAQKKISATLATLQRMEKTMSVMEMIVNAGEQ